MMSQLVRRTLAHEPAAVLLAAGTMVVALGISTAIFSVVYTTVLRPLPYPEPTRLAVISAEFPSIHLKNMGLSAPELFELETFTQSWAQIGAVRFGTATLGGPEPRRINTAAASAGLLAALGVHPSAGRLFTEPEDRPGAERVVVLAHGVWLRAFGADPGVVGRTIDVDGEMHRVVGIMPRGFDLLGTGTDLWIPLRLDRSSPGGRADHNLRVVGRIARGITLAQARSDLAAAVTSWMATTGEVHSPAPSFHPLALTPLHEAATGDLRPAMFALLGAVAFVLLLACANVCNVLLARAEGRRHQLAIRIALGASKRRLVVDHLLEGLCISAAGCVGGAVLAFGLVRALAAGIPPLAGREQIALDPLAVLFAIAAMGTCALFFGLAPALRIDVIRAQRWLRTDGRGLTASRERRRLQHALVTCQVAAALVLLFGAGLLLRSFWKLTAVDPGVNTENVVTFQVSLPERRFSADAQVWAFYDRFLERLATLSGVRETAAMSGRLPERRANNTTFFLEGVPVEGHKGLPQVEYIQHVTPAYFSTLRIPLLRGRTFGATDTDTGQPVAIVNETLARKFWPGRDPVGQRLRPAIPGTPWFTVVGVVADVKHAGIAAPIGTEVYVAYRQARLILPSWLPTSLHVVLGVDANRVRAVQQELPSLARSVEASAALANIRLLEESMNLSIAGPRFLARSLGAFAAIALVLASVGIYGVVAYGVHQRTTEFGVRTALGASAASIVRLVLAQAALPIAAGVALGFGGVFAAARLIASFLFQTTPLDPATIAAAVGLLTSIALAACWIPARRAACVDPLIALRDR